MPIASVSSSTGLAPLPELPRLQTRSAEQKAAAIDQFTASLPGNGDQASSKEQDLNKIAADIIHISQAFNKKLQFVVDQRLNEVIVKVIDKETDKVIKILPPEELLRLHRKLKETIGFLFNEQV